MKQLNVGIVGTGMAFERLHLPAYQELADRYRIVALCDIDLERARRLARQLGISEHNVTNDPRSLALRDDVDVVDILVPIELNYKVTEEIASAIAGSRKGIICEKPLAPTMKQAQRARELPRKYGVPILIAENYRYNEETQHLRRMVGQNTIGDTLYFIQNRVIDFPADMVQNTFAATDWRQQPEFPGGAILDTGVHDMAALQHIFGPVEEVHAYGRPQDSPFAPFSVLQANMRFASGLIGQFTMYCAGKEMQRPLVGLRIFGTEGMLYLEERDCGVINVAYNNGQSEQIPYEPQRGFYNELLNFHKHLTEGEPLGSPPEIEFGDAQVIFAVLESARTGRPVKVADVGAGVLV